MASSIVWTMFILRRRDGLGFVYFYYFIDIYICIYIYMYGSPHPQGPPEREGMYHLPSVVLNAFKDMLRNTVNFSVLCTSYWLCFDDFYSLIR